MGRRLTNRLLRAIVEASCIIEAGGVDEVQGHDTEREQRRAFDAIVDAGDWASEVLAKREAAKAARKGGA